MKTSSALASGKLGAGLFPKGNFLHNKKSMLSDIQKWFRDLLNSPPRVALYALSVMFFALILDGSLLQYWTLVREHKRLEQNIVLNEKQNTELSAKIRQAQSLEFVEHQARDRLDLVNSDELVFVFSDDLPLAQ